MNSFEFKEFEVKDIKKFIVPSLKMIFRRPLYSFVPFFIIGYLAAIMFANNVMFTVFGFVFCGLFVMPFVAFELAYSNDYSKIPFNNINYFKNEFLLGISVYLKKFCFMLFIMAVVAYGIDIFLQIKVEEMVSEAPQLKSADSKSPSLITSISFTTVAFAIFAYNFINFCKINFMFNLIFIPYLMNGIEQNDVFLEKAYEYSGENNGKFKAIMYPIVFLGFSATGFSFIFAESIFIGCLVFAFSSSFITSFMYLLCKYICDNGSKLEEKKKVFNFSGGSSKAALQN